MCREADGWNFELVFRDASVKDAAPMPGLITPRHFSEAVLIRFEEVHKAEASTMARTPWQCMHGRRISQQSFI